MNVSLHDDTYFCTLQVQASTEAGWGNLTTPLVVQTLEGIPSAPGQILRRFRNTSCLSVEWEAPAQPNGVITMYKVRGRE